jgi:hypothetical protein
LGLENGTETLSRNVSNKILSSPVQHTRRAKTSNTLRRKPTVSHWYSGSNFSVDIKYTDGGNVRVFTQEVKEAAAL